jgi:hypothetical protein
VSPDRVLEMVSLVVNKNPTTVKTKETVSKDAATVEDVVDVEDDEGTSKTNTCRGGTTDEETFEGRPPGVVDVAKGDVDGGWGVAGVGADGDRGDAEEAGLEEVGGRDMRDMVILSLKQDNSGKVGGRSEKVVLRDDAEQGGEACVS